MNTKELRDKIGDSSFKAIIKHPYYKEHLYTSHHEPEFHHETTSSGSHSTITANVPFGGKKKTVTFQYHKNKVYNAHYALNDKHIRSHKEVNESMENIQELSAKVIQSYLNKLKAKKRAAEQPKPKKPAPMTYHDDGTPMDVKEGLSGICKLCGQTPCNCTTIDEAKLGDKVTITHGSQKGLVGHVGEIRKGLGGTNHTYTVDYDDNGKRASVQVKKAHTKLVKEASIHSSFMSRGSSGMRARAPNASDMASYGTYHATVKHDQGEKTYKLKNMKDSKHATNVALKIHRTKHPEHKVGWASSHKIEESNEQNIQEVSKRLLGRYIEKSATSMASAAFGQGQASAQYKPPSEKDQKTGMKRMTGIARATSKLTKEEAELDEGLWGELKHSFAGGMQNGVKKKINPEHHKHYDIKSIKSLSDAKDVLTKAKAAGHIKEEAEQVDELKKSTLNNYLNKTVDPDLGLPKDTKKPAQRIKGIERATKKILAKEETGKPERDGKKRSREAYINKKNREEHQTHLGIHEGIQGLKAAAKTSTPHEVSLQLKHPNLEGVARKIVKVHATSPKHAEEITSKHYSNQGYKVHKIDYSKLYKQNLGPSKAEKEQEEKKKEDDKISKIAKAVKGALK